MDRRTEGSKFTSELAARLRERSEVERPGREAMVKYEAADRCRICRGGRSDLPNAGEVRLIVDRELMRNATYEGAAAAVRHLVMDWPEDERPTYTAVRNHARRHLKRDDAFARQILEKHAIDADVDVEAGDGSILTRAGLMALIMERTNERLRDGTLQPTLADGMRASEALEAARSQVLNLQLEEATQRLRAVSSLLHEIAPDALRGLGAEAAIKPVEMTKALPSSPSEPRALASSGHDEAEFACDICGLKAKSKGGRAQHRSRKHAGSATGD